MLVIRKTANNSPEQLIEPLGVTRLALPDRDHGPSKCREARRISKVAIHIRGKLGDPEIAAGRRSRCVTASGMPMPEASVNEHDGPVPRQDDVRPPRQASVVKAKSQTRSVQVGADDHLGLGVAASDTGHHPRPRLPIHDVGQWPLPDEVRRSSAACTSIAISTPAVHDRSTDPDREKRTGPPGSMRIARRLLVGRTMLNTTRRIISCRCL